MEKRRIGKSKIVKILYTKFSLIFFVILTIYNANCEDYDNFNIEVKIPKTFKTISPGETIHYTIEITNLANKNRVDVTLLSKVIDSRNKTIVIKTKTVAVETKGSFIEEIKLPKNINEGNYLLICEVQFKETKRTASESISVKKRSNFVILLLLFFISLIILFFIYRYVKRVYEIHEIKVKVKNLVKKKNLG